MLPNCEAPDRAAGAETGAHSLCLAAGYAGSNTSRAPNVQELTACIIGRISELITHLNAANIAAARGNTWGIIVRLRKARETWLALAKDAKVMAEIADESDGPEWPDVSLPQAAIWLSVDPEFGLPGRSRRFLAGPEGLAAALAFFELLEARQ
jgi:hypothetical protein